MAMNKQQFENWKQALVNMEDSAGVGTLFDEETSCFCALGVLCHIEGLEMDYLDLRDHFGWRGDAEFDPIAEVYRVNDFHYNKFGRSEAFPAVIEFLNENEDKFVGEQA